MSKEHMGVKLEKELKRELEDMARAEERSLSNFVSIILKEGVVHRREKDGAGERAA